MTHVNTDGSSGEGDGGAVTLSQHEALSLAVAAVRGVGIDGESAVIIAEHVLDAELRGHVGLSRIVPLAKQWAAFRGERRNLAVVQESGCSAVVDGGNQPGMVVAERATRICIAKARDAGMAIVAANNHQYSGLLSYYVEKVAREGLVGLAVATGFPRVAPHGGRIAKLGTNPLAFGFPTADGPIVVDLATSSISGGELLRRAAANEPLPSGAALDAAGRPTTNAVEAVGGVLVPWGGHRGSALAIAVQLLGVLCGMKPLPAGDDGWAFLMIGLSPVLFGPAGRFEALAAEFAESIRATPAAEGHDSVRMPFDRSRAARAVRRSDGVTLPAATYRQLAEIARGRVDE
jgi:LDH2 family malate/lactate/ureidoglycolate dehydrogenase